MDCEGCARKVKKALSGVKGAKSVDVDLKQQKASVRLCGRQESAESSSGHRQESGAVAVCSLHHGRSPLRRRRLRQEGAAQLCTRHR
ncbi:UNVERIFIED_CONTAM: Heavy metal-associated isoprenylated plant protein 24 [Sesamum calycinum]|uniref:Heavy metal-associated isoprenylated plant protein 24 n=1 Tax=Sesamum calycinum TaxID=2727403 RepID=A0AAW2KCH0_9LAMI